MVQHWAQVEKTTKVYMHSRCLDIAFIIQTENLVFSSKKFTAKARFGLNQSVPFIEESRHPLRAQVLSKVDRDAKKFKRMHATLDTSYKPLAGSKKESFILVLSPQR